jgi:DNA-binding NarL/FixJ family response regulator
MKREAHKLTAIIARGADEQTGPVLSGQSESEGTDRPNLNVRQVAVLRLVFEGLQNNGIASRMDLTPSAVKNTLQQLFSKVGVNNRSQLVRVALERYRDLL